MVRLEVCLLAEAAHAFLELLYDIAGSHRRVLALTFGPDFIPWRRSGESWPRVGPGRRLFVFAACTGAGGGVAAELWGRLGSSGLARACVWVSGVCALTFSGRTLSLGGGPLHRGRASGGPAVVFLVVRFCGTHRRRWWRGR
jgi:hypothetical protein